MLLFYYFVYLLFTVLYTVVAPTTLYNTAIPTPPYVVFIQHVSDSVVFMQQSWS